MSALDLVLKIFNPKSLGEFRTLLAKRGITLTDETLARALGQTPVEGARIAKTKHGTFGVVAEHFGCKTACAPLMPIPKTPEEIADKLGIMLNQAACQSRLNGHVKGTNQSTIRLAA